MASYVPRPAVALSGTGGLLRIFLHISQFHWLVTDGGRLERIERDDDGSIIISLVKGGAARKLPIRAINYACGSDDFIWRTTDIGPWDNINLGRWKSSRAVMLEDNSAGLQLKVPAETLVPYVPQQSKHHKPRNVPTTSLTPVKEAIKSMSTESPPPDFKPAMPLREAIDTINAYKAEEGDALELSVSKRGRLKVRYEYGG